MNVKERRKYKRRKIIDTFSLFVAIPTKGNHRLRISDVSEEGMSFDYEMNDSDLFKIKDSDIFEVHFYLNQTLFLSLTVKLARVSPNSPGQPGAFVGAEVLKKESKNYQAYLSFIQMIDHLTVSH